MSRVVRYRLAPTRGYAGLGMSKILEGLDAHGNVVDRVSSYGKHSLKTYKTLVRNAHRFWPGARPLRRKRRTSHRRSR
jgi:hypothetical protein